MAVSSKVEAYSVRLFRHGGMPNAGGVTCCCSFCRARTSAAIRWRPVGGDRHLRGQARRRRLEPQHADGLPDCRPESAVWVRAPESGEHRACHLPGVELAAEPRVRRVEDAPAAVRVPDPLHEVDEIVVSDAHRPHATSSRRTPKLYTSDSTLARPASTHSASMYRNVPATPVVCDRRPSSTSLASPKSPSLAVNDASSITLLGLTSRCTTRRSASSCRYSSAEPTPRATPCRTVHVISCLLSLYRWASRLPLCISS
jgi:hypothetical protein